MPLKIDIKRKLDLNTQANIDDILRHNDALLGYCKGSFLFSYTVQHVYSDYAYNEMMLITKHLGIPGKHSIYFFTNFTLRAKLQSD